MRVAAEHGCKQDYSTVSGRMLKMCNWETWSWQSGNVTPRTKHGATACPAPACYRAAATSPVRAGGSHSGLQVLVSAAAVVRC